MSVSQSSATPTPPSSETLHRLAVEAGKYLGVDTGDHLPTEEVIAQGEANRYTEGEVREWLEKEGYGSAEHIPVPPQGDVLGELWRVSEEPESVPEPTHEPVEGDREDTVQRFREWCEERAESEQGHSYTRRKANRRYAKAKDVDRSFVRNYEKFTTVLITYAREMDGESLAEHAESFYPRQITRKRRRLLKRAGVYDQYAGLSVLAPKSPSQSTVAYQPQTHAHDFLWLPSHVSRGAFDSLQNVDGFEVHISVEQHQSAEVETPESVKARGSGLDEQRGATTGLPQEVGENLPLLNCRFDARGAPEYIETWAAHLRAGTDDSFSTKGVNRFTKLGSFEERAESIKVRRELQEAHTKAEALEYRTLWPHTRPFN